MGKIVNGMEEKAKISPAQLNKMFPDNKTSEQWFIDSRWTSGKELCLFCDSSNITECKTAKRSWRCKDCWRNFSICTRTIMHASNLDFKMWLRIIYLITSGIGVTELTKLASDLRITQKAAWRLAMRIRETHASHAALKGKS